MSIRKFFRSIFHSAVQRGQVMVLYALLIPLLFLFVGVGIDLGWYYLNVSRLQNAADAAALAGAWELVEDDKTMKDYYVDDLTTEPSGVKDENYYHGFNVDTGEINETTGNTVIKQVDLKEVERNGIKVDELTEGQDEARDYAAKNLYDSGKDTHATAGTNKIINEWTADKDVTFSATLFTRILDADREKLSGIASTGFRYYKVELTETINHLFLGGFEPMKATVIAWAVIKPRDLDLKTILDDMEKYKVIQNVIYQDQNKAKTESYQGKWSHFQDQGVYYTAGDVNRTEVVNVNSGISNHTAGSLGGSGRISTTEKYAGSFDMSKPDDVDSLHLDFRVEYGFEKKFAGKDWDLRSELPNESTRTTGSLAKGWTADSSAADMRVLTSFNLNYAWPDRNLNDLLTDVLYVRIESDPLWFEYGSSWNSVHQIVLNATASNTATETVKGVECYTQRPFFIFYTGPEVYNANSTVRVSQPVILNLYNDWNGVLYMPNSPVIINGNGHKLTGFVVAKEYYRLKTADDMKAEGYKTVTDEYGKKLFTKQSFFTEDEVAELVTNDRMKKVDDKGNITITDKIDAPKHLILSITREKFTEYGYGNLATFKQYGLSRYIADTYKEQFKRFRGITDDSLLTTVKFPAGAWTYVNTEEAYTVAKSDLLTAPGSESGVTYIKVIDTADNTEKYLDKDKLPYIKIRRDGNRPYVSVYDLGNKKNSNDSTYAGVTIQDDSISATGNNTNSDVGLDDKKNNIEVKDHRSFIKNPFFEGTQEYKNYLDGSTLSVYDGNGYKYFIFKSDEKKYAEPQIIYEFRKVHDDDGNVFYIEEKEWSKDNAAYYTEVLPNGASGKDADGNDVTNPIIVDNWGDLQYVAITPREALAVETVDENEAFESAATSFLFDSDELLHDYWSTYTRATNSDEKPEDLGKIIDGKYRGSSAGHSKKDYLIPALERVYNMKKCFNLSEDSGYSYFQIEELKRVNYLYLNVNELAGDHVEDMFFTTKRAGWID